MRRDGGSVFPAHASTGDPNGPNRGLSANENARALISMMVRSKCSNQRPDTLMQDRSPPARRNHLQRTAGPYIGVTSRQTHIEHNESAHTLIADMPADMDFRRNGPRLCENSSHAMIPY